MSILDVVVTQLLEDLKYEKETIEQIGVAVIEAGMNAVKHGNKYDPIKFAHFTFIVDSEKLTIKVRDEGPGFDPARIADPLSGTNIFRDHGRGILMIRAYMDSAEHNESGNEIIMTKYLPR
jgi:serine/threonine-protein kinase RsbW